jgi:hypothetical protein
MNDRGEIALDKVQESRFSALCRRIKRFDSSNPVIREIRLDHIIIRGIADFFERTHFSALLLPRGGHTTDTQPPLETVMKWGLIQ